jgi:hypothetical protein
MLLEGPANADCSRTNPNLDSTVRDISASNPSRSTRKSAKAAVVSPFWRPTLCRGGVMIGSQSLSTPSRVAKSAWTAITSARSIGILPASPFCSARPPMGRPARLRITRPCSQSSGRTLAATARAISNFLTSAALRRSAPATGWDFLSSISAKRLGRPATT